MGAIAVVILASGSSLVALIWAFRFYQQMMKADPGTPLMQEIAEAVRAGANAYLKQQNRIVLVVFVLVAILLGIASFGFNLQSGFVPIAFLSGGFFSALCGWFGMKTATSASNRTAAGAQRSLNDGLQVAFRSGAVMGLTVVGIGLMYVTAWFVILYWIVPLVSTPLSLEQLSVTMLSFGMGASAQALFARVGGGIFTKAADVGADLVGKVEQSLKEDSPRNPATIADNVGDNVGDVAGMGADLYESYIGSILAASALGVAAFGASNILPSDQDTLSAQLAALLLPLAISGVGIVLSLLGIFAIRTGEDTSQKSLLAALSRGINLSSLLVIIASFGIAYWLMPRVPGTLIFGVPGIAFSIISGLVAGWLIGKWTEYCTSTEFKPTKRLADQAVTGPATIIIGGIADGMASVWFPIAVICIASMTAFGFANGGRFQDTQFFTLGLYGIGIAAVGMLSTLGITLATDAYGPIADNAGGNAEMSGLPEFVRTRTDALDALGNTTAATGKGFAIGSAALTALALLAAYVEGVRDGFFRWGDAVAAQVSEDGLYKVTNNLIVQRQGTANVPYLVLPTQIEKAKVQSNWQSINATSSPVKLSSEMVNLSEAGPAFAATGDTLISVKSASLRDFMNYYDATLLNPRVLIGLFLGAMATFLFCAMTMQAVGRAAQGMVIEVRRQLKERPGILDGSEKPDYARPIELSTKAAQREMLWPSVIGLALPILVGLLFGVGGVLGLLGGSLTTGFCLAVFMANSGGAWDNAKKYIESGVHGGKGSPAHKAAVVGDTVGDPFKDTSGPSLNILIKLMSMVSVVVAGLIVRYSLVALGWF